MKLKAFSLGKISRIGLMVGGLEIFWNLVLGRIPIYLHQPLSPALALLLNALVHLGITAALFSLVGFIVFLLPGSWFKKHYSAAAVTLWGIYLGLTVFSRYQNLKYDLFTPLPARIIAVLALAAGAVFLAGRLAQSRRPGWPAFLLLSLYTAVVSLLLRLPLHSWRFLLPFLLAIVLVHLLAWLFLRKRQAGLTTLAAGIVVLALLASAGRGIWAGWGGDNDRPHLVFLILDAVRADRMSLYGYPVSTTPFFDNPGGGSLLFQEAYSTSNYTFPSHISLFTGLYIRSHDMWHGTDSEMARYRGLDNLAGSLSGRGYRTLLLTENPWIAGLHKGFNYYYYLDIGGMPVSGWRGTWKDLSSTPSRFPPFAGNTPSPFAARQFLDYLQFSLQGYYKSIVGEYQLRLLREQMLLRRRGQPLFFFINWMNVHNRYYPAPGREVGKTIQPYDWSSDYDRSMVHIDRRFRNLWNLFGRSGELDRTIFVISSDHGELLGEYRIFGHTRTFFQGVIRVPLVFISKAWEGRQTAERPVSLVAVRPALEFLADRPPGLDLRNGLLPILEERQVVAEHRSIQPGPDGEYARGWMLVAPDKTKLIHDEEAPALNSTWGDTEEFLFDLANDPGEGDNLYSDRPRTVEELKDLYREWEEETPAAEPGETGRIAPGLKERLRAMGYLQ